MKDSPADNAFVRVMRKVYHPLGYHKGYNAVLAFLALGYLLGFTLSRLPYLAYNNVFCSRGASAGLGAAPGECFYWLMPPFEIGMKLHLFTILPAALLVILQFIPVIRHKIRLFHRLNGYLVITLSLISSAGALMVAYHAFGGSFATQTMVGTLVILTTIGYLMAYINIKLLQIDQHRAWMMRTWAWFATIITIRIIMIISAQIISIEGNWYVTRPCSQINYVLGRAGTLHFYPNCAPYFDGTAPNARVIVTANFESQDPIAIGASLAIPFGTAGWLALVLHTIAIELYSERLRQVSYERQLARGFKRPGYAGLVAERFGDAKPFMPLEYEDGVRAKNSDVEEEEDHVQTK